MRWVTLKPALVGLLVLSVISLAVACSTPSPTPLSAATPTPTRAVLPTAIDTFYGTPATYVRQLGTTTQTVRLGISPDFVNRPILPFFGMALADPKLADQLFDALTWNHFFRWQEADWANRSNVLYDEFVERLEKGEDLSYPAMDTRNGGEGAHIAQVNPRGDLNILLIPHHDGFVTFPGSPTDPGLSIKNTIEPDGSLTVRVPVVYAQIFTYQKGAPEIQDIVNSSVILALMELGIPPDKITSNDLHGISTWWESQPRPDWHRTQYDVLRKLLTEETTGKPIIRVQDQAPRSE